MPYNQTGDHTVSNVDAYYDVAGDQTININPINENTAILAKLDPVNHHRHFVQPCMDGTRQDILSGIDTWINDPDAKNIVWINGGPGTGKSALASSLISRLQKNCRLAGSYKFRRGDSALSDPAGLWRTVAHGLAQFDAGIESIIVSTIKNGCVDPQRPNIQDHFDVLIKGPLIAAVQKFSLNKRYPVIVVDALDECGDSSQTAQRRVLLNTIAQWSTLPTALKLIVTSRDDRIPDSLRHVCQEMVLFTGDQVNEAARTDVEKFFLQRFSEMNVSPLAGRDGVLRTLTTRAAVLFIWAKTVMDFIDEGVPEEQLDLILAENTTKVQSSIHGLYQQVTTHALRGFGPTSNHAVWQPLLSVLVLAKAPSFRRDLKRFIIDDVKESAIDFALERLKCVISTSEEGLVYIQHLSFVEFLLDSELCPEQLAIRPDMIAKRNTDLLYMCLQIMLNPKDGLRFNICQLETSYICNCDVDDMDARIAKHMATPLRYVSRHWGSHVGAVIQCLHGGGNNHILELTCTFFHNYLLQWLEVLTLVYTIPAVIQVMIDVKLNLNQIAKDLADFANDAQLFIVNFMTPISESLPHIYLSALPFAPHNSLISKYYLPQFTNTLCLEKDKDTNWPSLINVLNGHTEPVRSIAISPDSTMLASNSGDETIRIWDITSGQLLSSPSDPTNIVGRIVFVETLAFLHTYICTVVRLTQSLS